MTGAAFSFPQTADASDSASRPVGTAEGVNTQVVLVLRGGTVAPLAICGACEGADPTPPSSG
ncbi:hypothetical protein ACFCVO_01485 [Agromyces sp. NPDC056379]|uniref:hypothetical protein n=1 Tax=unclassified Agromyces TaxID=2639701 RepID=UPI0035D72FC5